MDDNTRVFNFPESGNNDLATLLALNGNRGWGNGLGGWGGGLIGFILGALVNNNGNGLFGGGGNNNDLLMLAITSKGELLQQAINQLSTILNADFNLVDSAITAISTQLCNMSAQMGMTPLQIINAMQAGNSSLSQQLCSNFNMINTTLGMNAKDDALAICNQTNTLLNKIDSVEDSRKDREITALTAKVAQLESLNFTTGVVLSAVSPILGQLANITNEIESIKRCQPATVTLPNNLYTAVPTILANAGADFVASYWANRLSSATTTDTTTGGTTTT